MATASSEMVAQLSKDATTVKSALAKFGKHLESAEDDAPSRAVIGKVADKFKLIQPQIEKFDREIKEKPPRFPEDGAYRDRRKDVTALLALLPKIAKQVALEQAQAKSGVSISVVSAAENEIVIKDKKLAQALKAVARGDKGRTGPKDGDLPEFNHIHIGGNAKWNLLFNPKNKVVYGTVDFHIDSGMAKSQQEKVKKVAKRSGGKITVIVNGDDIRKG